MSKSEIGNNERVEKDREKERNNETMKIHTWSRRSGLWKNEEKNTSMQAAPGMVQEQ